jgi:hypothetical protein
MKKRKEDILTIEDWLACQQEGTRAKREQLVIFLGLKSQIMEHIGKGFTLRTIHKYLTCSDVGYLNCHYDTFRRYVKKYITLQKPGLQNPAQPTMTQQSQPARTSQTHTAAAPEVKVAKSLQTKTIPIKPSNKPTTTGFNWSPNYNEDDLF